MGFFTESQELDGIREEVKKLRKQNKKLRERPEILIYENETPNTQPKIRGTRDVMDRLIPGNKFKLQVIFEEGQSFRFETPMMLVETPKVIVETTSYHTHLVDDIVPIRITNKESEE